jgi:hypothetical protein
MSFFLEFNEKNKILKSLNFDDSSIEDLEEYIFSLNIEIKKSEKEIIERIKAKKDANNIFK